MDELRQAQLDHGARQNDGPVAHFGDPAAELTAALEGCALGDRSELGRLLGTGPDLLDLLHRLSTADLRGLATGQGRPTVLTTNKGRIVERLFVSHLGGRGVLLVGGAGSALRVTEYLKRFTFREQTGLVDATDETRLLTLVGPLGGRALQLAGLAAPQPFGVAPGTISGAPVHVLGHDGLSGEGFALLAQADDAGKVWRALHEAVAAGGGRAAGTEALEARRVLRGLPAAGAELTEDYNPLEAGLREAVSFSKGCYVGQEVVARLNTYDKVSRALVGLLFDPGVAAPETGAPILLDEREIGRVTSALTPPGWSRPVALGFVKRRDVVSADERVTVGAGGGLGARLVALPIDPSFGLP